MFIRSAAIQFEKRYGGAVLNCDDYEQEGRIALLHAAKRYMPEKGKFLTYAAVVVCTAMLDALRQTHPEINTVSLEENQAAVEAMQSDNPALSRDIYHKSPEQLYLDKEKMLELYDAMNRSSLRDTAWVCHRFAAWYRQVLCANSFTSLAELSLHRAGKPALNYLVAEDRGRVKGGEAACEALDVNSVFCYQPASSSCISMYFMLMYFFPPHWVPAT